MGQAKQRGTREERVKQALERKRPLEVFRVRRQGKSMLSAVMAMLGLNVGGRK